jgi:hypothetical protein
VIRVSNLRTFYYNKVGSIIVVAKRLYVRNMNVLNKRRMIARNSSKRKKV